MIIIIPTIKYGSTYCNTFTMGVCSNYRGYFFECAKMRRKLWPKSPSLAGALVQMSPIFKFTLHINFF